MKRVASTDLELGKVYTIKDIVDEDLEIIALMYLGIWKEGEDDEGVRIFKRLSGKGFIGYHHPTLGEVIPFPIKGSDWYEVDQN